MKEIIEKTIEVLKAGGIILYPTDTIWGLGCDATNYDSVAKLYRLKGRTEAKSMLVLVYDQKMLEDYVDFVPEIAYKLIKAATRPLTIVYPKGKNLASNLYAEDESLGIRIPNDEFCSALIKAYNKPIVSTSANFAGERSPLGYFDINENLKKSVDYIVPFNQEVLSASRSSDIVKVFKNGEIQNIR